jgi:nitrite reductase (NADH) large subunit
MERARMKILIIGNGIAGVTAAARLRKLEPDPEKLSVEIYTREPFEYYSRIRLPEVFTSHLDIGEIEMYHPGWYEARHIQVYKNMEAVRLHRSTREVEFRNAARVHYDRLVLALGADSFKPPIPNAELDGVFTVREYGDADALRRYVTAGTRNAVVLGGGLLGLEAARHLLAPGIEHLTIVETASRLLPRQLDEDGGAILKEIVERWPARVVLGTQAVEFIGARRVQGLRLSNGECLDAETVLVAVGIKPRIELCREAGLAVDRGVIVDEQLRSSDPDIYVAGDLVEYQGVVWGIIPAALDHAPVVANNILGRTSITYHQTIPRNTLKVAGVSLTSIGKVVLSEQERPAYQVMKRTSRDPTRYEKYVLSNGTLAGCILLGSRANLKFAGERIGQTVEREEMQRLLEWD